MFIHVLPKRVSTIYTGMCGAMHGITIDYRVEEGRDWKRKVRVSSPFVKCYMGETLCMQRIHLGCGT